MSKKNKKTISYNNIFKDLDKLDKIFNLIDKVDFKTLNQEKVKNITEKANSLKNYITKKYPNNLDSKE